MQGSLGSDASTASAKRHNLLSQACFERPSSGTLRVGDLKESGMTEPHAIDRALKLGRVLSPWSAQPASLPPLDRCTLPPSRLQRAQELIAMARAARSRSSNG